MLTALEWAAGSGLEALDLGTSSRGGVLNEGLSAFKAAHGGVPHWRETFERTIG
jgi:hypothetical protein